MAGPYNIIYADPPWSYNDKALHAGGAELHYRTVSIEDLGRLPVAALAAPDAALFMWATSPTLPDAFNLMRQWGFQYKTVAFVWGKTYPSGTWVCGLGHWTRSVVELCLLGVRGKPKRLNAGVSQFVAAPRARHSAKPPEVRQRIVQLLGDLPRIELFAREAAPGWDRWGNEIDDTPGVIL